MEEPELLMCVICYQDFYPKPGQLSELYHDGCKYCHQCYYNHILTQINKPSYLYDQKICCPGESPQCNDIDIRPEVLLPVLEEHEQTYLQNLLLKKYVSRTDDVRYCPKAGCGFFGVIKMSQCADSYTCPVCTF